MFIYCIQHVSLWPPEIATFFYRIGNNKDRKENQLLQKSRAKLKKLRYTQAFIQADRTKI